MMCCKPMNVILSVICAGMIAFGAMGASAAEPCDGFRPLLNGKDLTGWTNEQGKAPGAGWVIEDGVLVRKGPAGNLWTKERFGDFVLDMEFKTNANSGILLRCDKPSNYVQTCIEIQVLPPGDKPHRHSCGAFYDCVAPTKEMCKAGEWNHVVITAKDNKLTVVMNDEKIIDIDLNQWTQQGKNPDGSGNKFGTAIKDFKREGHFGVQDHGGLVAYRNIKIKPLAPAKKKAGKKAAADKKAADNG